MSTSSRPGERALQSIRSESYPVVFKVPSAIAYTKATRRKKIMEEERYLEEIGKIIERDFYPDLEKLKAQNEYLDAVSENNVEKIRQLYSKYSSGKRPPTERYASPATFETPTEPVRQDDPRKPTDKQEKGEEGRDGSTRDKDKTTQNLDQYLTTHTSEDNESFKVIQQETINRHRDKYAWLYKDEEAHSIEGRLALPSIEQQAIGEERNLTIDTWSYKNKNHCMYVPEGVILSQADELEMAKKRQEIEHTNTRFTINPFNERDNREKIEKLSLTQAKTMEGRIGIDGKIVTLNSTPKVNGYGFVKTPSPMPGVTESPLMTWGEIEGTPFRLDGGDTPIPMTGPSFRIAEPPKRERIALELADKAQEINRDKKRKAIEAARSNLTPLTRKRKLSSMDRLSEMSPAAQRLVSVSLARRSTDRVLSGAFTPSPRRTPTRTPLRTPNKTPNKSTPKINLTDNLLRLPQRLKASDFF